MLSTMKLSTSSQCIKYLMFIFNLLFVITGIILLSIGSVILGVYSNYFHFLDEKFLSVPNLLIAIGAIIFFVAFFGCCGAVRENYCMIITFTTLLVLIFIMELAAGISGYVLRDQAHEILENKMLQSMQSYNKSGGSGLIWDDVQTEFYCCGTVSYIDWSKVMDKNELPSSCCDHKSDVNINCFTNMTDTLYHTGCLKKLQEVIKSHAVRLGGAGIGIAFIQAMGIWFSVYLARAIKRNYETV